MQTVMLRVLLESRRTSRTVHGTSRHHAPLEDRSFWNSRLCRQLASTAGAEDDRSARPVLNDLAEHLSLGVYDAWIIHRTMNGVL